MRRSFAPPARRRRCEPAGEKERPGRAAGRPDAGEESERAAALEVADILRDHGPAWREANRDHVSLDQLKVMSAIERCRTAVLGGHVARCENAACGHTLIAYNSCRNRHCPKCQAAASRRWLADREAELLPVPYFHVVYTLPSKLRDIAYQNKRVVYDLLMKAAADTTLAIAANPKRLGARIGITAVLHTWGSTLTHHPHVHMIVPGGGLSLHRAHPFPRALTSSCMSTCWRACSGARSDYPMVAANYAATRSAMAKAIGLGQLGGNAVSQSHGECRIVAGKGGVAPSLRRTSGCCRNFGAALQSTFDEFNPPSMNSTIVRARRHGATRRASTSVAGPIRCEPRWQWPSSGRREPRAACRG